MEERESLYFECVSLVTHKLGMTPCSMKTAKTVREVQKTISIPHHISGISMNIILFYERNEMLVFKMEEKERIIASHSLQQSLSAQYVFHAESALQIAQNTY